MSTQPSLFRNRVEEIDPEVIVYRLQIRTDGGNIDHWEGKRHTGRLLRVFPTCWREVLFLQMLPKYISKWAPLHGDGVLIDPMVLAGPGSDL